MDKGRIILRVLYGLVGLGAGCLLGGLLSVIVLTVVGGMGPDGPFPITGDALDSLPPDFALFGAVVGAVVGCLRHIPTRAEVLAGLSLGYVVRLGATLGAIGLGAACAVQMYREGVHSGGAGCFDMDGASCGMFGAMLSLVVSVPAGAAVGALLGLITHGAVCHFAAARKPAPPARPLPGSEEAWPPPPTGPSA